MAYNFGIVWIICTLLLLVKASVKWKPEMKSFTHAVKQGGCKANQEVSLFEYTNGPGVITEQWFTGKGCINQDTVIRYYVDGSTEPSIEINLYLANGIGFPNDDAENAKKSGRSKSDKKQSLKTRNRMPLERRSHIRGNRARQSKKQAKDYEWNMDGDVIKETTKGKRSEINTVFESDKDVVNLLDDEFQDSLEPNDDATGSKKSEPEESDSDSQIPWGTRHMGHLAKNGGIYNTFRIPFRKSIFISLISKIHGHYWYTVRGVRNYPVIIGDLELPEEAKLKVYKKENALVKPFEYEFLANSVNKSGLLFLVSFITESENCYHQEACFRVITDSSGEIQYLSSGTEDLFLSAYYYSGGPYHNDQAGLSYKQRPCRVGAYKFFEDDPVIFKDKFALKWRCGEQADNTCFKIHQKSCTRKYGSKSCVTEDDYDAIKDFDKMNKKHIKPAVINSYIWVYEW